MAREQPTLINSRKKRRFVKENSNAVLANNRTNGSSRVRTFEWPKGNNPERVDVLVGPKIVGFDVMPMARFFYAW
jgi:hypothetical protein